MYLGAWTIRWRSRAVWSGGHACLYSGVAVAQQSVVSAIIRSGGAPYNGVSWGWRRAIRIYWTGRTGDGDPCSCRGLLTPHLRPRTDARRATARTHACNTRQSERPATRMVECDAQRCDPPPAPATPPATGTAPWKRVMEMRMMREYINICVSFLASGRHTVLGLKSAARRDRRDEAMMRAGALAPQENATAAHTSGRHRGHGSGRHRSIRAPGATLLHTAPTTRLTGAACGKESM